MQGASPQLAAGHSVLSDLSSESVGNVEASVELKDLILKLSEFAEQSEKIVGKALEKFNLDRKKFTASGVHGLAKCPFDSNHVMPGNALFRHWLRCPQAPARLDAEADVLIKSLRYSQTTDSCAEDKCSNGFSSTDQETHNPATGYPDRGDEVKTAGPIHNPNQINLGSWFFYEDAPAVVQEASYNIRPPCNSFRMPKCISDEISDTGSVEHAFDEVRYGQPDPVNGRAEWLEKSLLPSELWMLEKEVLAWKDLSTVSSSFPLVKAVLNLKNIDKNKVTDWLLINSPSYGIVLDSTLAQQVFVLLRLLFHVAHKEALNSIKSDLQKHVKECTSPAHLTRKSESIHIFFHECLSWLLCILCILYHPPQARALVLELVKFCVILSAQTLCYTSGKIHRSNQEALNLEKRTNDIICTESKIEVMGTKRLKSWQVDAAIAALLERAYLEDYVNGCIHTNRMSKANLISEYEVFLQRASIERNLRPNCRAVLEHDSLIWHPQQQEGSKKHKTKEELLAEERDYKRRRMSYRGKKIRRTPTQVLHDIIDSHMGKIVAAGGIGCFGYQKNSIESVAEVSIASEDVPGKSHCESVTRSPQRQHDRYSKVSGGEKSRPIAGERNTKYADKEDRKGFREARRHGDREDRKASREDKYGPWYDDKDGAYNTGYDMHYKSSGHDKQALHDYEHRNKHSEKTREQRKAHANRDFSDRSGVKTEDGKHRKYEDYDHSR